MKILKIFLVLYIFCGCNDIDSSKKENESSDKSRLIKQDSVIKSKVSEKYPELGVKDLRNFAENYRPKHLNLNKDINDSLEHFKLDSIFRNASSDSLIEICKIFLLKQSLYHLKRANQHYNLLNMRKGGAKRIIDYYLTKNNIDTSKFLFIHSGRPYNIEKSKKQHDSLVQSLIEKNKKESERIIRQAENNNL